jgi:hypothetical protein
MAILTPKHIKYIFLAGFSYFCIAQPAKADFIYGIADNNLIYEINTSTEIASPVFNTGFAAGTLTNAYAYDAARKQFFFVAPDRTLRVWGGGPAVTQVATRANLGLTANAGQTTGLQPESASYFNNAFWFVNENRNILTQINLDYTNPSAPTFANRIVYTIANLPAVGYGDIAINPNTGLLYGATETGLFYTLNLNGNAAAIQSSYSLIRSGNPSLQLAFSADFNTLYGQEFTGGVWSTVNVTSGVVTNIPGFTTPIVGGNAFRDLSSGALVPIPGPLPVLGLAAAFGYSRKLRSKIKQRTERFHV